MVRVYLGATLSTAAGGRTEFDVEAGNIMQLLKALGRDYPKLAPLIERGVAVAIDVCIGSFLKMLYSVGGA